MKNKILNTVLTLFVISLATAQEKWDKHLTPVLNRSAMFPNWKGLATADPFVIKDQDTLKMWFSGSGWLSSTDDCPHVRIGYAWSFDGKTWTEYPGNPILDMGTNLSDFDADGVETPSVLKNQTAPANQRYQMWYAGRNSRCVPVNDHKFGYAYSPDGIHWTKYAGNPVMVPGNSSEWYNTFISGPSVLLENGIYKMWFAAPDAFINGQPTDGKGNIGYATSADGISWSIHPQPVLIANGASAAEPSVFKKENKYYMFYSTLISWDNETFEVGCAISSDGITWENTPTNPVLKTGLPGQWDSFWASHPTAMYDRASDKFMMWYTGRDTSKITDVNGYHWEIGYAESTKSTKSFSISPNPVTAILSVSLSGKWTSNPQFLMYNTIGQLVFSFIMSGNLNVNISQLAAGIYIVQSTENEGAPVKIIKQ